MTVDCVPINALTTVTVQLLTRGQDDLVGKHGFLIYSWTVVNNHFLYLVDETIFNPDLKI